MSPSTLGYAALAILVGHTLWTIACPAPGGWWQSRPVFAALLGLTIIAAHAPALKYRHELPNPDEAQLLAGALTLRQDYAPWRSVDLSTAGPLSVLPFLVIPAGFLTARWVAAVCSTTAVLLCWLALSSARDNPLARIAALPVAAFFVFMQDIELFQFSTEHVAVLLLLGGVLVWMKATRGGENPLGVSPALGLGLCLGAAIMGKLQSAPCAAWLSVAFGGLVLMDGRTGWPRRLTVFAALAAGCITTPLFFAGLAASQGVLSDMGHSYVLNNVNYVSSMGHFSTGYQPNLVWGLNYLLKPVGVVGLLGLGAGATFAPAERRTALVTVGLAVSAIIAVVIPGRGFGHYWFFVLGPVMLAFGTILAPAWRRLLALRPDSPVLQCRAQLGLALLLLVLPVAHRLKSSRDEALATQIADIKPVAAAGEQLRVLARPGDALTVWGWRPELHAYSGLPQGTRDAHSQWQIAAIPQRDYYRRRFLADLDHTKPRFFADAVGPGGFAFTDRAQAGHETFPALGELVKAHYTFVGETNAMRLYVRHAN